jgi:hypothetical protein
MVIYNPASVCSAFRRTWFASSLSIYDIPIEARIYIPAREH